MSAIRRQRKQPIREFSLKAGTSLRPLLAQSRHAEAAYRAYWVTPFGSKADVELR